MNVIHPNIQFAFFRMKKLKGKNIILNAAKHNKRTIAAELIKSEKINPSLTNLNQSILDDSSPEAIAHKALLLIDNSQKKPLRKDAVRGIECVFSLPNSHTISEYEFFQSCTQWVSKEIGGELLSVDIHRDESSPHCHILLLPLVDGKMNGSRLVGDRKRLVALQESFHANVAKSYGFSKPPKKLFGLAKNNIAQDIINHLVHTKDPATNSVVWQSIKDAIFSAPLNFALDTGIQVREKLTKPQKTMAQIFTSSGKGSRFQMPEHIGFENEKNVNICSVGFQKSPQNKCTLQTNKVIEPEDEIGSSKVDRELQKPSAYFNSITGEFEEIHRPNKGIVRATSDFLVLETLEKIQQHRQLRTNQELNDL